jgi:hypothetical protein
MNTTFKTLALTALAGALAGCAMAPSSDQVDAATQQIIKSSFREQGIAKLNWLEQDASNKACSEAQGKELDPKLAKAIEAANLKTVKMPSDGVFLGDWKAGEKIAQNGRGMTWSDKAGERQWWQLLQLPSGQQGRAVLRLHRSQPLQLRQDPRRHRPRCRCQQAHCGVHLEQDVELQGFQRLLGHATIWACGHSR